MLSSFLVGCHDGGNSSARRLMIPAEMGPKSIRNIVFLIGNPDSARDKYRQLL